jgi:hypothetical protein
MKIIIKKEDSEEKSEFNLDVDKQSILELKEMIAKNNFGPIVKEQRLEFNGKRLKNNHVLSKYSLKDGSEIILKHKSASSSSCSSASSDSD